MTSARPRGGYFPAAKTAERILSPACAKDTTLDCVIGSAARELLPSPLSEAAWMRRTHGDIPALDDWQLRREIRIIATYLDTPAGQGDFYRAWFEERVQRLRAELARRREADSRSPATRPRADVPHATPQRRDSGEWQPPDLRPSLGGAR
ncbi:hypothetical protein HRbin27_00871 [bacterium HR27]|nr:hypothetical protein HRbin27_00871 [bacterium HR27]